MKTPPILIVEDDPEDMMLTREALSEVGLGDNVFGVNSGEELLDYLLRRGDFADPSQSPVPGLVLLDLNMPRMGGGETLVKIRSIPELKQIPVVVLTTSKADGDVLHAYEQGANSFITKPVTYGALVNIMKNLKRYWFETARLPNY